MDNNVRLAVKWVNEEVPAGCPERKIVMPNSELVEKYIEETGLPISKIITPDEMSISGDVWYRSFFTGRPIPREIAMKSLSCSILAD